MDQMTSADHLHLEIVTPEGLFLKSPVEMVEFPSREGELGILPGHIPMMVDVSAGELRVLRNGGVEYFAVAGGFAVITPTLIRILATFASAGEMESNIESACQRARQAMEIAATESPEIIAVELLDLKSELIHLAKHRAKR